MIKENQVSCLDQTPLEDSENTSLDPLISILIPSLHYIEENKDNAQTNSFVTE